MLKTITAVGAADSRGEVAGPPQLLWAAAAQDARQRQIWAGSASAVQAGTASIAQQSCWRSSNPQVRACTQMGSCAAVKCCLLPLCLQLGQISLPLFFMCPAHS